MGVGHASGRNLTTGTDNVFLGYLSGENVTSGSFNVFTGSYAGNFLSTGSHNVLTGSYAGNFLNTGSHNVFTGSYAGNQVTTGTYNLISGSHAGNNLTTGSQNVFLGYTAGVGTIDKYSNVYVGFLAGNTNNEDDNVAVGAEAMLGDKNKNCVFLGKSAGENAVNNNGSIFIGKETGQGNLNTNNVFIGYQSGMASTAASENTFLGTATGFLLDHGGANTLIGHYAGHDMWSAETGNTFIGHMAAANFDNPSGAARGRNTAIGVGTVVDDDLQNSTAIGQSSRVCTDNTIVIGSNNGTNGNEVVVVGDCRPQNGSIGDFEVVGGDLWAQGFWSASDIKLKRQIKRIEKPLEIINHLSGYTYLFKSFDETQIKLPQSAQVGLIAQELEKFFPYAVKEGASGYLGVNYQNIIPLLLEGIKEQNNKIEELQRDIINLKEKGHADEEIEDAEQVPTGRLYQNVPNPSQGETEISYEISSNYKNAYLQIFDLNGQLRKKASLGNDKKGTVIISVHDLQPGIYAYSLVVDNYLLESKTMVISK
jgi:hypothetical protein